MSRKNRNTIGWWLPALIGLILIAAGIRYFSSRGWLPTFGGDRTQSYETISSGASVQVSAPAIPIVPETTLKSGTSNSTTEIGSEANQPRRMW